MPKYTKLKGELVPKVIIEKTWFVIPVVSTKQIKKNEESYLVTSRVADYLEMLENELKRLNVPLPMLPLKEENELTNPIEDEQ